MNIQQLRYVRALAETKSFRLAADHCHVTQPSLSNAIAQLEQELGRALFLRTTRSVRLTDFGNDLLPNVLDVLNAQATLLARAHQLVAPDRALIRIGVSPLIGVGLVDLLSEPFRRENPATEIVFREMNLTEMIRMVQSGHLDFVFGPMEGDAMPGPDWQMIRLHDEPLVYLRPGPRQPDAATVALHDLCTQTFVLVPDACGLTRTTRALFQRNGIALREYPGQAMSYRVLQDWAEIGIGAAILPLSKAAPGTGAPILAAAGHPERLRIAYHALWRNQTGAASELGRFARYLADVAPAIAAGLVPPPAPATAQAR